MDNVPSAFTQTPTKMTATWIHTCILLLFNTVVTRRYALCIKYNQYAQPQKICHQGSYKLHGNFQELQISIQSKNKDHMKQRSYAHSMFQENIHKLLVCLYQLYETNILYMMAHLKQLFPCHIRRCPSSEESARGLKDLTKADRRFCNKLK